MLVINKDGNLKPGIHTLTLSEIRSSVFICGHEKMKQEWITKRKQLWNHAEKYFQLLLDYEDVLGVFLGGSFCSIYHCSDLDAFFEVNIPPKILESRNRARAIYFVDQLYRRLDHACTQAGWAAFSNDDVIEQGLDIYPSYFAEVPGKRGGVVVQTYREYFSEDRQGRPRGIIQIQKG